MTFTVGQKVVCIDGSPPQVFGCVMLHLAVGAIYTVRSIHTEPHIQGYGVRLEEVENSLIVWDDGTESEWSYASERFRPAEEAEIKRQELITRFV